MSLLKRNSPSKTRARKYQERVGETIAPTLGPVQEKITEPDQKITDSLIDKYAYVKEKPKEEVPEQLNRSLEPLPEVEVLQKSKTLKKSKELQNSKVGFSLFDLSFMCEERLYKILFEPLEINAKKIITLREQFIHDKLNTYAEYSTSLEMGALRDTLYYYKGEILIPEELIDVSGFLRKFLDIEKAHVLYDTGEILLIDLEYCKFWYDKIQRWFEPIDIPLDRPKIADKELCLDCNLRCAFRYKQQMSNTK
jgi:hypothetical protein